VIAVSQTAAQVMAAIARARTLFSSAPEPARTAAGPLVTAAQSTRETGALTADLSGVLVARHADFVGLSVNELADFAQTDRRLQGLLHSAARETQAGAKHLDELLTEARALAQIAGQMPPGAPQQAVVMALRSLLKHTVRSSMRRTSGPGRWPRGCGPRTTPTTGRVDQARHWRHGGGGATIGRQTVGAGDGGSFAQ
jgi:hypothetical protein